MATGVTALFVALCLLVAGGRTGACRTGTPPSTSTTRSLFHDQLAIGDRTGCPMRTETDLPPLTPVRRRAWGSSSAAARRRADRRREPDLRSRCSRSACTGSRCTAVRCARPAASRSRSRSARRWSRSSSTSSCSTRRRPHSSRAVWLDPHERAVRPRRLAAGGRSRDRCRHRHKQTFPLYVAGFVAVVLRATMDGATAAGSAPTRGRRARRSRRPWYLACMRGARRHRRHGRRRRATVPPLARPPRRLARQPRLVLLGAGELPLFPPLLAFVAVGVGWATVDVARPGDARSGMDCRSCSAERSASRSPPSPSCRTRTSATRMPLLAFLAILATGWIARVPVRARGRGTVALDTGGRGEHARRHLRDRLLPTANCCRATGTPRRDRVSAPLDRLTFYSNQQLHGRRPAPTAVMSSAC